MTYRLSDESLDELAEAGSCIICTSDCCNHYSPDYDPDQPCEQLRVLGAIIAREVADAEQEAWERGAFAGREYQKELLVGWSRIGPPPEHAPNPYRAESRAALREARP